MYLTQEFKTNIFQKNSLTQNATDTGSAESQVALFTSRINEINSHLKIHKKDSASRLGLVKLVGKRKKLLEYLQENDIQRYRNLIASLQLRK